MSRPRNWASLGGLAIAIVLVTACGGPATTAAPAATEVSPQATEAPPESAVRFAVILSGPWDDNSWNEAAYNAVQALKSEGVDATYAESVAEGDEARVLQEWLDQGYTMIVAHGFGYQDGVFAAAAEHPEVNFAWAGGINRTAENVADYDQPFYEPAYPIGIVAGHMSETGTLGAIHGFDVPVCHAMGEAFLAGAKTVNSEAQLITTQVGDWIDVAKAKEAALAQADAGVDYWIECGEGPALGTIQAAQEVGGWVTSYVGDMTENGPDVVLVNLIWNLEPLFKQMIADTQAGTFANKFYKPGVADGSMLIAFNQALQDQIPGEAIQAAEAAMEQIKAGELEVPYVASGE